MSRPNWLGSATTKLAAITVALLAALSASAQVSYTGTTITENFDSMGVAGTTAPANWTVGTNFGVTSVVAVQMGNVAPVNTIQGWNVGITNVGNPNTGDRSLGTGPTGGNRVTDVHIINNSGVAISSFAVSYDAEKWRNNTVPANVETMTMFYSNVTTATTAILMGSGFDYPGIGGGTASQVFDGNLGANRIPNIGGIYTPAAPIQPGETIVLRWFNVNDGGTDCILAIDNFSFGAASPIAIVTQPQTPISVNEGFSTNISVVVSGTGPTYQWHGPAGLIAGATSATLTIGPAVFPTSSGNYFCVISGAVGSPVTSANSVVTVVDDVTAPVMLTADFQPGGTVLIVTFNEAMGDTAFDRFSWSYEYVSGPGSPDPLDHSAADPVLSLDRKTLTFSSFTLPGPVAGNVYKLIATDGSVTDANGNPMVAPDNEIIIRNLIGFKNDGVYAGTHDTYLNATVPDDLFGANVEVLVDGAGPIAHGLLRFDDIIGPNPGQIPAGALINSATLKLRTSNDGDSPTFHRMLVAWNDTTDTWNTLVNGIQNDGSEAVTETNATIINPRPGTIGVVRDVDVTTSVQAWSDGAANFGWVILPGGTDGYRFDSSDALTTNNRPCLIIDYVVLTTPPGIDQEPPVTQTVTEGQAVTISADVSGPNVSLQWCKNSTNLPGATASAVHFAPVKPSDAGVYQLKAVNEFGSTNSRNSQLIVIADTNCPTLVTVSGSTNLETITVTYSEVVKQSTAENIANYNIPGVTVLSATLVNGTNVVLTLAPPGRVFGVNYTVTVTGVTDPSEAMNPIKPGSNSLKVDSRFVLVAQMGDWKYETNNLDGQTWQAAGYNDSSWLTGQGMFGFETTLAISNLIKTTITNTLQSFYLRALVPISFPYDTTGVIFEMNFYADDGIILYNNGTPLLRVGIDATNSPVLHGTPADAARAEAFSVTNVALVSGNNYLAVEVHNATLPSSDIVFGMQIIAHVPCFLPPPEGCEEPTIAYDVNTDTITVSWTGSCVLVENNDPGAAAATWGVVSATSPYVITGPTSGTKLFFRLRTP